MYEDVQIQTTNFCYYEIIIEMQKNPEETNIACSELCFDAYHFEGLISIIAITYFVFHTVEVKN